MSFYEYWIGRDTDYNELWDDFESGSGYINKYMSMESYVLRLTFKKYSSDLPIFNFEAIYKTVKGTFHDLKRDILPSHEYDRIGPLFIYDVSRGTELWTFLAELKPLLLYSSTLVGAIFAYQKFTKKSIEITENKLSLLKTYFPKASNIDVKTFMKALTPIGRNKVINKLIEQG